MSNKVTLGGDRLGSGGKISVDLKTFNRSNQRLSRAWRSSMSSGTLVPFISQLALVGDVFDIDLECDVKTLPTNGPLFGKYKVQLDVFLTPVRLWNGIMHMNKLEVGNDMTQIKFPQVELRAWGDSSKVWEDNEQINSSCIFSYLNIRGLGRTQSNTVHEFYREFNAIPYLNYWNIYKQYYANKQEKRGFVIHNGIIPIDRTIVGASLWVDEETQYNILELDSPSVALGVDSVLWIDFDVTDEELALIDIHAIFLKRGSTQVQATNNFETWGIDYENKRFIFSNYSGDIGAWVYSVTETEVPQEIPETSGIQLTEFPLENIDNMTMDILADIKNPTAFKIDIDTYAPYGLPLETYIGESGRRYSTQYSQEGLGIKTYQSDMFNNWVNSEWVNTVNSRSSVSTAGNTFTIDALNIANKVYQLLNSIAVSGGTLDDWQNAVYATERVKSVESPMYMGGLIKEIAFEEVISNADVMTEDVQQPLGTLAGRGVMTNKHKGGKIKIKANETGWITGIVSITPILDYSQGNGWETNLKNMGEIHVPHLDQIGFEDRITDAMAWFDTLIDNDGDVVFKSAGKVPAWQNYMTAVNEVRGNFAQESEMWMTLNRRYESGTTGIQDLTTYIDPVKFNQIFAYSNLDSQNFWVQIGIGMEARRIMSAKVMPNL